MCGSLPDPNSIKELTLQFLCHVGQLKLEESVQKKVFFRSQPVIIVIVFLYISHAGSPIEALSPDVLMIRKGITRMDPGALQPVQHLAERFVAA